jgi:hypothetical protein
VASPEALRVARTASRWGTRPSRMLGLVDDVTAFALDEALDMRLSVDELRAVSERKRGKPPDGTTWATEADYCDDLPSEPVAVPFPELVD